MKKLILLSLLFTAKLNAQSADVGLYHNGTYLPPRLPEWGQEHPENKPWKYKPGEAIHEFTNGKLQFFIVTDVEWDNVSKDWRYKKVADFRIKL